jgi:hemerythrin-like domain-containing protein
MPPARAVHSPRAQALEVIMNPAQLLVQDHRAVVALFRKLDKASDQATRQRLGEQIIEELSIHATIEEQLVYPILRARGPKLEDQVLEALEEHHAMKLTLAELDKMNGDEERYAAKFHVVREAVQLHIEEEEAELLPRLRTLLDPEERRALAEAMVSMKAGAPDHPHPLAPDTPPGNAVAGALAKVVDLGKDVVRKITNASKAAGHKRVTRRAKKVAARGRRRAS